MTSSSTQIPGFILGFYWFFIDFLHCFRYVSIAFAAVNKEVGFTNYNLVNLQFNM